MFATTTKYFGCLLSHTASIYDFFVLQLFVVIWCNIVVAVIVYCNINLSVVVTFDDNIDCKCLDKQRCHSLTLGPLKAPGGFEAIHCANTAVGRKWSLSN